jgi:ABC-type transporter Mla MlaB component
MENFETAETIVLTGNLSEAGQRLKTREKLEEKWKSGVRKIRLDLSGVTEIDFDALTELLAARNRFIRAERMVELKNIPERINRIIQIFRIPVSGKHDNQYP